MRTHDAMQHCTELLVEHQAKGCCPDPEDSKLADHDTMGTIKDAGVKIGGLTGGVLPLGDVDSYLNPYADARKVPRSGPGGLF